MAQSNNQTKLLTKFLLNNNLQKAKYLLENNANLVFPANNIFTKLIESKHIESAIFLCELYVSYNDKFIDTNIIDLDYQDSSFVRLVCKELRLDILDKIKTLFPNYPLLDRINYLQACMLHYNYRKILEHFK